MVVTERFHEIARDKLHVVELREVENMRLGKHGRGDIQLVTNVRQVLEKVRIGQLFGVLVYELFADSAVRH